MIVPASQVGNKTFDYVVVGGGTSGLTVAVRLSENPSVSVLVIEAGPPNLDDPAILTPAAMGTHLGNPKYDWAFQTVPQASCHDRSIDFNRGKGLGGSSAINFFAHHRPPRSDIDAFGELGNPGWNWDLLEPYYAKAENFMQPEHKHPFLSYDLARRGSQGPLTIAYSSTMSNFEGPFLKALKGLGVDLVEEPFAGETNGAWMTPVTVDPKERIRSYAANKYYQPNASRENLTVIVASHVTKIVTEVDAEGLATAVQVLFHCEDAAHAVGVGKEVILSAGAIMSPQILELSGIGDKDILQAAGVTPIVHLPGVGCNVQEHIFTGVSSELRTDVLPNYLTFDLLRDPEELVRQQKLYETSGTGVFGMSQAFMAFLPLASISPDTYSAHWDSTAAAIATWASSGNISEALNKQYQVQLEHLRQREPTCEFVLSPRSMAGPNLPAPGKHSLTIAALLNHPFSRGTIHIKSGDAFIPPVIDPHYFEEELDLVSFVEQIKYCRRILDQESLKSLLTGKEINPGPHVQTDEQIAEYLKSIFTTTWHTVGSCSMLPLRDGGVVDHNLKVYHTSNIRVVDVSIIPLHIGAHLQATAYALGERGADIVKGKDVSKK
ncbi:alcohol oxidase [Mycena capillaripes]|nr:alcohol oxidase [Mycena capillaripes]